MHLLTMQNITKTFNKNYLVCNYLISANQLSRSSSSTSTTTTRTTTNTPTRSDPPNTGWHGIPQYDLSAREIENVKKRHEIRRKLKAEFNRYYYNPWTLIAHVELLDPAVNRWMAMRASYYEYWKPTWKGFFVFIATMWGPILTIAYIVHLQRREFDRKCETGEISYEQRKIKWS